MTPNVSANSAIPATVRWAIAIAGTVCERWNGAYSGVPSAAVNSRGCRPNSIAAHIAEALMPTYAPKPPNSARRGFVKLRLRLSARYTP